MHHVLLAARTLRRSPAFTITAIATLAIGIGATTAIGTVLCAVVLEPLPYADASRLFSVRLALPGLHAETGQSLATYAPIKQFARSIDGVIVYDPLAVDVTDVARAGQSQHVGAALVSANVFSFLGASLALGRTFTDAEDAPHGAPVVILSNDLWRERYGADRTILGKRVLVDGLEREIIGVAKPGFQFPDGGTRLWLPIALDMRAPFARDVRHRVIVKLRNGVTASSATHELDALLPRSAELFPAMFPGVPTAEFLRTSQAHMIVRPLRDDVIGSIGRLLWVATGAGVLILLTACANVASLILARADSRQRDFSVRVALGATTWRIFGQQVIESVILAVMSGAIGLALAGAGVVALRTVAPAAIPRVAEVGLDGGVVALALVLTFGVALLTSAVPVVRSRSREFGASLRERRSASTGRVSQRARRTFVVVQVAFAVVLACGAVLLLRSFSALRRVRPGYDADHTLALWLSLPKLTYPTNDAIKGFTDRLLSTVAAVPGVREVGVTSMVPLNRLGRSYSPLWTDNDATSSNTMPPSVLFTTATGDYFHTMGIPLIAGRTFLPLSRQQTGEVIIDQSVAELFWHDPTGQRALGRRLKYTAHDTPWYTVVGVVGSVHDTSLATPPMGQIYLPDVPPADPTFEQVPRTFAVVLRFGAGGASTVALHSAVRALDPTLAVYDVSVLSDVVNASMARLSFVMVILSVAGGVALTLAAVGLYGVITYIVTLRTAEIGLRIALGAGPEAVSRLVAYQGAGMAVVGIAVGVALFAVVSRFLRSLLYGVGIVDPLTLVAVSVLLMAVTLAASWLPAQRAARIDPVRALTLDA